MASIAVLADIHGNLEALEAVLRDLEPLHPARVVVLGDTVGYGPDPRACLERASELADVLLAGNHEKELLFPSDEMTDEAQEALRWTAAQLAGSAAWEQLAARIREQGSEAARATLEGCLFVHGSPQYPTEQYIWPAHECQYLVFNDQIDARLADFLEEFDLLHSFFAHTHAPAVLTAYDNHELFDPYRCSGLAWHGRHSFVGPTMLYVVPLGSPRIEGLAGRKVAINPGSVGQPRFVGDPDASYALYDGDAVSFRRVPYDRAATCRKLAALPFDEETREFFIERLERGA